jgi:hypothetical protein
MIKKTILLFMLLAFSLFGEAESSKDFYSDSLEGIEKWPEENFYKKAKENEPPENLQKSIFLCIEGVKKKTRTPYF